MSERSSTWNWEGLGSKFSISDTVTCIHLNPLCGSHFSFKAISSAIQWTSASFHKYLPPNWALCPLRVIPSPCHQHWISHADVNYGRQVNDWQFHPIHILPSELVMMASLWFWLPSKFQLHGSWKYFLPKSHPWSKHGAKSLSRTFHTSLWKPGGNFPSLTDTRDNHSYAPT